MITVTAPCPAYNEVKRASDREFAAKYDKVNADLYKYLSDNAGEPISSIFDVETLFNILEIEVSLSDVFIFILTALGKSNM